MLLICFHFSLFAQSDSTIITLSARSVDKVIDFRVPQKEKIKEYQDDSRFDYKQVEKGLSLWDRIILWFTNLLSKIFSGVARSGIPGIIVLIVIVLLVCLIVLKLLGLDYRTILGKKGLDTPAIDIYTENVHEMDFDSLIANAMKNKDYRLVVRFLYLKNLKILSDKDIIEWKTNKTNYSYQHEIKNAVIRSKFLEATLIFDYIWYGEFVLDESKFSDIYNRLTDFTKMISNER